MFHAFVFFTLLTAQISSYERINCDDPREMNDIYIESHAWFACDAAKSERLESDCIICSSPEFPFIGQYIGKMTLQKFLGATRLTMISTLVVLNADGYQYINCDYESEKNDIYINSNAWFACDIRKKEHFRYCVIFNDSIFSGKYISRDTLAMFPGVSGPINDKHLELLCNNITSRYSCQDIEDQIDGEYDIYRGDFCVGSKGKIRRYINEQVMMKDCNRADMLYGH
uniref:Uncharacterized protein n=1 Tax=Romanomermis culicivorax TaxID=13658 RepID=A0A915HR05_ROMCU